MRYKIILASTLLLGIAVIIYAQFCVPVLLDADGYLHIRMAKFIQEHGLRYDFHWARYSVFAKNFADKDFLYHLLLIPFALLPNIFLGAKISACVFAAFLYLAFFLMLRRYSHKALVPVFLIALLSSAPFLHTLCRPRNMVLAIALCLLFIHLLIEKKHWALFIITVIYALSHISSPFLFIFSLVCESIRFISRKEFAWKNIAAVLLGLLTGFLIHPNFPNNFLIFYLNGILVPIFALKWGLELGAEFFPLDTREFVLGYPFIIIALFLLIALGASDKNKIKFATRVWLAIAGIFFLFSFFSQRYIVHCYPVLLIAAAAYISDWWQSANRLVGLRKNKALKICALSGLIVSFAFIGFSTFNRFKELALAQLIYNRHYEAVANWMSQNIPAGETVFHSNWSDSQYFIGLNPQNDYFVTLDPIFMYYWNPKKYSLYRDIAFGRSSDPYTLLKDEFDTRYGYVGKNYFSGLINQIRIDKRFEVMAEDGLGLIFRLKPAY